MSGDQDPTASPHKYSRYRSVRHQMHPTKTEPAPPVPEPQQDAPFSRTKSMARYRRSRVAKNELADQPLPPPVPSIPLRTQTSAALHPAARDITRRSTEPIPSTQRHIPDTGRDQPRPKETERERLRRKAQEYRDREEAQRRLEEQEAREAAEEEAELARRNDEEAAKILAVQKRKDLERLEAELDAAARPIATRVTSPGREKFSFFSRKRAATRSALPRTPESRSDSGGNSMSRTEAPRAILEGGGGIVPQTDVPISASNAGERRVLIRCKQSSINLPITPETTPVDLTFSAANIMSQNVNPSTAVLLESYTRLGLERRLRKYEHVRDVMNSWDRDTQNALLLQDSESPSHDYDLETSAAPKEAPPDVTVYMYHSQKPHKWNKRYITLLSSGQIFVSKKPRAKMSDKDINNICHLSDFDIYTSTPQYTRKTLKPPKKHCYAIKSQQKTTMFLSTENFVHYFSTDDSSLASIWYSAVQRWRSWYLVNRMGEGAKKSKPKPSKPTHVIRPSTSTFVDENPYTIGSFAPLMNTDRFADAPPPKAEPDHDSDEENRPLQIPFHLRNSSNPIPTKRDSKRHPPPVSYKMPPEAEEFSSSGLLGRTYSQRQKTLQTRDPSQTQAQNAGGPFLTDPDVLLTRDASKSGSHHHQRTNSMHSVRRPTTSGEGMKPKPLLDFTPQFKEAPQWDKRGKGRGVKAEEGVMLVEVATTHEAAQMAAQMRPERDVFRRDQVVGNGGGGGGACS
ncbi:hypothetical protein LOCC1_G008920, partial [Lachnellula occidentalis]